MSESGISDNDYDKKYARAVRDSVSTVSVERSTRRLCDSLLFSPVCEVYDLTITGHTCLALRKTRITDFDLYKH